MRFSYCSSSWLKLVCFWLISYDSNRLTQVLWITVFVLMNYELRAHFIVVKKEEYFLFCANLRELGLIANHV